MSLRQEITRGVEDENKLKIWDGGLLIIGNIKGDDSSEVNKKVNIFIKIKKHI